MKYSVVVLFYHRTPELTKIAKDCVMSVAKHSKDYELIVVDNCSTEDIDWVLEYTKPENVIRQKKNLGIAAGWNAGLKKAKADHVAVINDDIIVRNPKWLDDMKKACDMPDAGVGAVHVQHLPCWEGLIENYHWFPGSCYMLPKSTVEKVGYFDEDYWPCNWEDVDYWTRLMGKGLKMYVNYSMTIFHLEGKTLHAKDLSKHFLDNKKRYVDKWGFDCTQLFYGGKDWPEYEERVKAKIKELKL